LILKMSICEARESLIKSGRIMLGCKMIKIETRNASNSRAIAKFRNTEINYFAPKMVDHDLIRGSLSNKGVIRGSGANISNASKPRTRSPGVLPIAQQ
jgi:hypothetical protein